MASIERLVPKAKGQGDWTWEHIKPVLSNPDALSFDSIFRTVTGNVSSYGDDRDRQRRQAIWIFCVLLFHEGRDNYSDRQRVLGLVHQWDIDEAIFHEMKDIAETYRVLSQAHIDGWDMKRKEEFTRNKNDLDKSIRNLIELG